MKRNVLPIAILISILLFFVVLMLRQIPALYSLELKTIDWRFQLRGATDISDSPIVLVTIDDQSFESLPDRWPWPRYYYAKVIENLTEAGAAVIGLDVMLDVPDKHGAISDQQLADAIGASGRVVLTGKLEERVSIGQIQSLRFDVKPIPKLLEQDSAWGVIAIQADADGIYRRSFVVQKFRDEYIPSFGAQVLRKYLKMDENIIPEPEENLVNYAGKEIRVGEDQLLMINYAGPASTFPSYSFDTVIDDEDMDLGDYDLNYFSETLLPEDVFRDKIVLIGATVTELHDNFPTPFFEYKDKDGNYRTTEMPGVEVHANAIRTMLDDDYISYPPNWLILLIILFFIAIPYFLVMRFSTALSGILSAVILVVFLALVFVLFGASNIIVELVAPTLALVLAFVASNLHEYVNTAREKKQIIGAFERFVPEKVVKELLAHPEKLALGGEERFLTVIFLDLADFTSVSEKLTPAQLVNLINYYLTEMTEIILKYDGIIDKYEGDAIMAEFGAPVFFEDHAVKACYAALEMQRRIRELDLKKFSKVIDRLRCRIGINSGDMIVGNMGSKNVFDYTVMGDAVNLASRLEGANKAYNSGIMMSGDTYHLVKDFVVSRPLDLIRVKGRQKPVRVFEVLARKDEKLPEVLKSTLPVFISGIRYYHHREWDKAQECFEFCVKNLPGDGPSKIYLDRARKYRETPPPENWDGVYTMTSK